MYQDHIFNGRKIFYTDSGTGFPIVLLHGYLETSEVWGAFRDILASEHRVICVDLPGHGKSAVYGETHTMEFMATAVKDLLDSIGIARLFMTGHSLGGYVTLAFLELFPDYLSGYSLFHSHPFADPPEAIEKRIREIAIVEAGKKDIMYPENVARMFANVNLGRFQETLSSLRNFASQIPGEGIIAVLNGMIIRPSRLSFMEEGRVPCLWILGLMDNYIPCELIQQRVKLPANAKVVILNNSGHLGFIEEAVESAGIISDFISVLSENQ